MEKLQNLSKRGLDQREEEGQKEASEIDYIENIFSGPNFAYFEKMKL